MIKSNHKPKISKKKQLEMQLLIANRTNPVRKRLKPQTTRIGSNPRNSIDGGENDGTQSETIKRRKIVWKENPMKPKTPPK